MLALLHLAALLGLVLLRSPLWVCLALAAAIAASATVSIRRQALRLDGCSVRELILREDGMLEAVRGNGSRLEARISRQSTVFPWLVVILLVLPGSRHLHPLVIPPDALPPDDLRALRTWLRWKLT